ncbi:hypothetical protein [Methanoregula formicica]|uniref:Uncharacterized protein n=1 Tax=Methanoregula formicica (strain DSM 22288 / NBRC 105244 / SMSP) TaxID=593750 RepID=L0HDK7_METFS|nr:hypothetical protein [Methanoregula formicica]AGB02100.1 hypothetical protein Metfor_1051 [Methanoregula formicica SMSP]
MNCRPVLLIVFVVVPVFFLSPVQAADLSEDELLRNAQNLSLEVPEKGTALLGSQESMGEMVEWLNACSRALIGFFNDTMNLLGLSNTSYVKDMNKAFEPVLKNPPAIHK